jgi:hypothetical protein
MMGTKVNESKVIKKLLSNLRERLMNAEKGLEDSLENRDWYQASCWDIDILWLGDYISELKEMQRKIRKKGKI